MTTADGYRPGRGREVPVIPQVMVADPSLPSPDPAKRRRSESTHPLLRAPRNPYENIDLEEGLMGMGMEGYNSGIVDEEAEGDIEDEPSPPYYSRASMSSTYRSQHGDTSGAGMGVSAETSDISRILYENLRPSAPQSMGGETTNTTNSFDPATHCRFCTHLLRRGCFGRLRACRCLCLRSSRASAALQNIPPPKLTSCEIRRRRIARFLILTFTFLIFLDLVLFGISAWSIPEESVEAGAESSQSGSGWHAHVKGHAQAVRQQWRGLCAWFQQVGLGSAGVAGGPTRR